VSSLAIRPTKHLNQRRSHRIMLAIPILVSGTRDDGRRFDEETQTVIVNAHGALILLKEELKPGQSVTLRHLKANEDCVCTVTDVGAKHDTLREVGIELLEPSAKFWHVGFPPGDWNPRGPEAKRFTGKRSDR
jgi:hypothetical protein